MSRAQIIRFCLGGAERAWVFIAARRAIWMTKLCIAESCCGCISSAADAARRARPTWPRLLVCPAHLSPSGAV
jgi:hypothetical protein